MAKENQNEPMSEDLSLRERMRRATRQMEGEIIRSTLERHRWNRRRTAESLKISYRSLMYKMKTCNLRDGDVARPAGEGDQGLAEMRKEAAGGDRLYDPGF